MHYDWFQRFAGCNPIKQSTVTVTCQLQYYKSVGNYPYSPIRKIYKAIDTTEITAQTSALENKLLELMWHRYSCSCSTLGEKISAPLHKCFAHIIRYRFPHVHFTNAYFFSVREYWLDTIAESCSGHWSSNRGTVDGGFISVFVFGMSRYVYR